MLSIIVAIARGGAIGRQGDQPFFIREDLRRFKQLTLGHPIIMGRKTYEALPKRPLPGRQNIVITRNPDYLAPGATIVPDIAEAIKQGRGVASAEALRQPKNSTDTSRQPDTPSEARADEMFVIGGGMIYREAMPLADRLYVTEIDEAVPDADTHFPIIQPCDWRADEIGGWHTDPATSLRYRYVTYNRIL